MREPGRSQIDIFVDALFRHARQGYVSHRAFIEGTTKVFRITPSALTGGLSFVADVAEDDARRAANNPQPAVFCPPICTFTNDKRAAEKNIAEGLALSVECDDHPAQAQAILEDILGSPTVSVLSGGKYVDPDTGEIEDKRHLHWRLSIPATGKDLIVLKEARRLATQLVNGDEANNPICHPMRWPGSWHCKAVPTLCRIEKANSEIEIDLPAVLAALKAASPNSRKAKANGHDKAKSEGPDWVVLIKGVLSGDDYHNALTRLAMRLLRSGMHDAAAVNLLRAWMRASAGPRDERWCTRFNDIPRGVSTARAKIGDPQDEDADADGPTELLDPWQRYTAPPFPLKTLPPVLADYVTTQSRVIGCSASGLAMATLAAASGALRSLTDCPSA
jgi:hypothetical protein